MKRLFSLIELIIVVVVLGILAAIVIPNISSIEDKTDVSAIKADKRNIQTAVDMYKLDNYGELPSELQPVGLEGELIDFKKLHINYLRSLPKVNGVNYWVDGKGKVFASTADSPMKLKVEEGLVTWEKALNAKSYNVYEEVPSTIGFANNSKLKFVDNTENNYFHGENGKNYFVSSLDSNNLESIPVGPNYSGVPKPLKEQYYLHFDGVDDYVEIPHSEVLNFGKGDFTYSLWVKFDKLPEKGGVDHQITSKRGSGNNFELQISPEGKFRAYAGGEDYLEGTTQIRAGEWHYIAVTKENGILKLYVNGNFEGERDVSGESADNDNPLMVGRDGLYLKEFLPGVIADLKIWNKALSEDEVTKQSHETPLGNTEGLVGYWKFNEGEGNIIKDYSGNNLNGEIKGASWVKVD